MSFFRKKPAPYQTRENLPQAMRSTPFDLLRSKLYSRNRQVTVAAVESGPQNYYAFLPQSAGYRGNPIDGINAVYSSELKLKRLSELAAIMGRPAVSQYIPSPPEMPHAVALNPGKVVGYGIHNIPPDPVGQLPPAGYRLRAVLQNSPWLITDNPTDPQKAQSKAEEAVSAARQVYFFDPVRRLP